MVIDNKKAHLIVSNLKFIIERLRIVSRLFMVGYMIVLYQALQWVYGLPDLTGAQAAILSTLTGIATPMTKFYVDTGKNLYDDYEDITYANKTVMYIDQIGYLIDKFRVFPVLFVLMYLFSWYGVFDWAMSLGADLSNAQATFVSIYSAMAAIVFGLLTTSGDLSINLEKNFLKRFTHNSDNVEEDKNEEENKQ